MALSASFLKALKDEQHDVAASASFSYPVLSPLLFRHILTLLDFSHGLFNINKMAVKSPALVNIRRLLGVFFLKNIRASSPENLDRE